MAIKKATKKTGTGRTQPTKEKECSKVEEKKTVEPQEYTIKIHFVDGKDKYLHSITKHLADENFDAMRTAMRCKASGFEMGINDIVNDTFTPNFVMDMGNVCYIEKLYETSPNQRELTDKFNKKYQLEEELEKLKERDNK